jgi:hypothetical protein
MNYFGEALQKIAFDNGHVKSTPESFNGEISKSPTLNPITFNIAQSEPNSGEVQLGDSSLPEAPLALTGDERYPTDQFVYMYDAVNDAYSLGRSDNEVADYESQGFIRYTAEQQAAWRDAGTSAVLDVNGLPWDVRIHAASKARNADDSWRIRRTPKDKTPEQWTEYYDEVIAELKQLMQIPVGSVEPELCDTVVVPPPAAEVFIPAPPVDATHVMTQVIEVGEPVPVDGGLSQAYTAVVTPIAPPVVVPPPVTTIETVTFPQLMTWLTARHGKITVEQINGVVSSHGLPALQNLAQRPDLIPQVIAELRVMVGE